MRSVLGIALQDLILAAALLHPKTVLAVKFSITAMLLKVHAAPIMPLCHLGTVTLSSSQRPPPTRE